MLVHNELSLCDIVNVIGSQEWLWQNLTTNHYDQWGDA